MLLCYAFGALPVKSGEQRYKQYNSVAFIIGVGAPCDSSMATTNTSNPPSLSAEESSNQNPIAIDSDGDNTMAPGKVGGRKWEVVEQLADHGGCWFWLKTGENIYTAGAFFWSGLGGKRDLMAILQRPH
ncbi:hypothetical protein Fot_11064 [Forsythia ovata]|uniref:Uncharacterized protein n=1 Tax=Forsythia ovata TaxID=205694 RepID=A0ABD1WIP0_9LAMI